MMESPFDLSEKKPLRWGVIGCGSVTEKKSVPAYQMTSGFEVTMVMRRDEGKVQDFAKKHDIPNWTTIPEDVIENPDIDAIYIATPPDSHKHYALQVATAGKPCCIEKPMATNYSDCVEIVKAFEDKHIPLFVAYYRRSLPRFLKIKQWLDENQIGTVEQIRWKKTKSPNEIDFSGQYNWRTDKEIALGGYFDDLASHGFDLFAFLLGDIVKAEGNAENRYSLYTAYDFIKGNWTHANGVKGAGFWDFGCDHRSDEVVLVGSQGRITFSVLDEAPLILHNQHGETQLDIPNPEHIQHYHVANIKNHLLGLKPHPSTGKSGAKANWVMDRILGKI